MKGYLHEDHFLLSRLLEHDASLTSGEIIHLPERVEREHERKYGDGEDVEEHPTVHVLFAVEDADECPDSVDGDGQDKRDRPNLLALCANQ
jgi:hypothetical protein